MINKNFNELTWPDPNKNCTLSPKALVKAAQQSHGNAVEVQKPIQLIVHGEPESD